MDELVKLVMQKTGISEAQAKLAVTTVINFLKERLPAPLGAQLDTFLNSGSLPKDLGGLFGKK